MTGMADGFGTMVHAGETLVGLGPLDFNSPLVRVLRVTKREIILKLRPPPQYPADWVTPFRLTPEAFRKSRWRKLFKTHSTPNE